MGWARVGRYKDNQTPIGWTPKELLWLEAALTLPAVDFLYACEDIAGMSLRTVAAVTQKARELKRDREIQRRVKLSLSSGASTASPPDRPVLASSPPTTARR